MCQATCLVDLFVPGRIMAWDKRSYLLPRAEYILFRELAPGAKLGTKGGLTPGLNPIPVLVNYRRSACRSNCTLDYLACMRGSVDAST